MTGGHTRSAVINRRLARAAQHFGIAMGVGSQRAGLANSGLGSTYSAAREAAPDAVLIANIGAPQLVSQGDAPGLTIDQVRSIVDSIDAQGLAIHLNYVQEMMQPEGDRNARGVAAAIREVVCSLQVPVLAKETGAGISREAAELLRDAGVSAIDVAGWGGTSMVRIEGARRAHGKDGHKSIAEAFENWGIPTPAAILESRGCGLPIVATGGIRSGVDAARAFALGADVVGVGLPFLRAADEGEEHLHSAIETFIKELKTALFLTGSRTPGELKRRGAVVRGELLEWQGQRGL
jgi:isopentenyl-diphosphate delta-isomerase